MYSNALPAQPEFIAALEAEYDDVVLSPAVKQRVDKSIETYGVAKSVLELHCLAFNLCLGIDEKAKTDNADDLQV